LSLGYFYSSFTNAGHEPLFPQPPLRQNTASVTDAESRPPDNHYYKVNLKGRSEIALKQQVQILIWHGQR